MSTTTPIATNTPDDADEPGILATTVSMLRGIRGLTQPELADLSGVDQGLISRIERGRTTDPHVSTVQALASALSVRIEDLLVSERGAQLLMLTAVKAQHDADHAARDGGGSERERWREVMEQVPLLLTEPKPSGRRLAARASDAIKNACEGRPQLEPIPIDWLHARSGDPLIVSVTSAKGGVGKSTAAINMGAMIVDAAAKRGTADGGANPGPRVLVLDGDLEGGVLSARFDRPGHQSLALGNSNDPFVIKHPIERLDEGIDASAGEGDLDEVLELVITRLNGLDILSTHGTFLQCEQLKDGGGPFASQLLARLRLRYDVIIIDCGIMMSMQYNRVWLESSDAIAVLTRIDSPAAMASTQRIARWMRERIPGALDRIIPVIVNAAPEPRVPGDQAARRGQELLCVLEQFGAQVAERGAVVGEHGLSDPFARANNAGVAAALIDAKAARFIAAIIAAVGQVVAGENEKS